ncbi:MAG: FtsX-like permease family protein, partial [Bacteroidetes bacterium]|nr:FtsX-like permease family protein [Bacteroidota bacterium]
KMSQLLSIASFLILTVAFLGLFGIVALSVSKRTREIGLRKVLGASVADIVSLISREFAFLLLVALMVAIPIAWFAMDYWLTDFAVRISIGPWSFVFAGLIVTTIAFLTLGSQSVLAARSNPIDVLRDE